MTNYDVIVVGGGPVGSLLALELARAHIRVAVLDAQPSTPDVPKAGTIHARSIQLLTRRGYLPAPDIREHGSETEFHYAGILGLRIGVPASEGAPIAGIAQSDLERSFHRLLATHNVPVLRGAVVTHVHDRQGEVTVSFEHRGHPRNASAAWVIGCDGSRSIVRRTTGFDNDETAPTCSALLGTAHLKSPFTAPAGWTMGPNGWTVINPNVYGESRFITFNFDGPERNRHRPLTAEEFQRECNRIAIRPIPMETPTFLSRFSDYSRLATSYRLGRVLLAGDAAHVHFPLGGQGLNLGINDAINLAWKLGLVINGQADQTLLHSYTHERRDAARKVIANTADQRNAMRPGPAGDQARERVHARLATNQANRELGLEISAQNSSPACTIATAQTGNFLTNMTIPLTGCRTTTLVDELAQSTLPIYLRRANAATHKAVRPIQACLSTVETTATTDQEIVVAPDGTIVWTSTDERRTPFLDTVQVRDPRAPRRAVVRSSEAETVGLQR